MSRAALIIICPGETNEPESLPGTEYDATGFKDFLCSDVGGDWREEEVKVLRNPTQLKVLTAKLRLCIAEYAFVVFSGHGYTNPEDRKVYLPLADTDLPEENLICNKKQTIVVDACRSYLTETRRNFSALEKPASARIPDARTLFDNAVRQAETGYPLFLHAASDGQTCAVGVDGSFYIQSLLEAGKQFGRTANWGQRIRSVGEAHYDAKKILSQRYPLATQDATLTGSVKRQNCFPFAVCPA